MIPTAATGCIPPWRTAGTVGTFASIMTSFYLAMFVLPAAIVAGVVWLAVRWAGSPVGVGTRSGEER